MVRNLQLEVANEAKIETDGGAISLFRDRGIACSPLGSDLVSRIAEPGIGPVRSKRRIKPGGTRCEFPSITDYGSLEQERSS